MSALRADMYRLQELVRLHRMGTKSRDVARLLRMSPKTELGYRTALTAAGLLAGDPADLPDLDILKVAVLEQRPPRPAPQQRSSVERWAHAIREMRARGAQPRAIFDRLRLEEPDFAGSLSAIKRFCARLDHEQGVQADDVVIPVETGPGEIAQVDFGYVGKLYDPREGVLRKAWVFVMVLGYSRHLFARVVFDQRVETWLALHQEAFRWFGAVPQVLVPDYVPGHVIGVLCRPRLCGVPTAKAVAAAFAVVDGHITVREIPATGAANRRSARLVLEGIPPKPRLVARRVAARPPSPSP